MIRSRNPDVFLASWASIAPVQPQLDNYVWWKLIQQTLPTNCAADVHAAVTYADQILSSGSAADVPLLKKVVFLTNSTNPRNTSYPSSFQDLTYFDVASILAHISMSTFCNRLETWNPSSFPGFTIDSTVSALSNNTDDAPSTEARVAATYGAEKAFYAYLFATIDKSKRGYQMFPTNPRDPLDNASWVWQLCTQFAQFQVAPPPSNTTIVSQFYNLADTYAQLYHALFPYAPPEPDISPIQKYGGWRM
ncbi:hypothetical protein B0O99DRAFT_688389 [Bisporella sp. PMI_857]|nr:hypothetical protein B0O99DRAFT_688389 [Bisporella sp. PMI_857]